jgi:CRP/FNR family transcriptional regulator, cyclic AMP receptor protein
MSPASATVPPMAAFEDPNDLGKLPLFEDLAAEDLVRLNGLLRRRQFPSNTRVMSAQQPGEALFLILEGSVKIQLDREDGTEITLALLGPGDTVGEMSLIEAEGRSANVVTVEDTTFLWMDRASFLDCLSSMTQLTYNLVRQLSSRLRLANQKIQALSTLDVAGRVARQILIFAEQYGRYEGGLIKIPVPLTQSDIAEMVGATRERVNHAMVAFKQAGTLAVDGQHHITIHDRQALADRCR